MTGTQGIDPAGASQYSASHDVARHVRWIGGRALHVYLWNIGNKVSLAGYLMFDGTIRRQKKVCILN